MEPPDERPYVFGSMAVVYRGGKLIHEWFLSNLALCVLGTMGALRFDGEPVNVSMVKTESD